MFYAFGGQSLNVELAVESPEGHHVVIKADLYQKGQSLLAPIQKDIAVADTVRLEKNPAIRPLVSWTLPVPEVKRETQMLARFRTSENQSEWTPAGQILVTVYPPGLAKEGLAAFGKAQGLHVFGNGDRLRDFLKAQQVEFDDAGTDLTALPPNPEDQGVYLGEATSAELTSWLAAHPNWRGNLVVFCPDSPLLPGVFVTAQSGYRTVKVTLPLLDTLATDPRGQKTLLEILHTFSAL